MCGYGSVYHSAITMNRTARNYFMLAGAVLLIIVIGCLLFIGGEKFGGTSDMQFGSDVTTPSDYVVPPMEAGYTNEQFRFSLTLPQGVTAAQLPFDGKGTAVVLQDASGNGIQIYVTENVGDTRVLREADIKRQIPDMQVTGVQAVEIGENNTGVAFLSDNEAYNGASREVWFVFNGNLYQISTYARLDNLLQAMFGTWKFY